MAYLKQKNLITITASLIGTLAMFFLIIRPTIIYIKNTKEQIKIEREELEKRYQRIMYLRENAKDLKEIEDQLVVLDDLFLIKGQELKFITTLENIAEKNNVSQKIDLKSTDPNLPKQTALPFEISASGASRDMISYLLAIEQLSYYINFDSLNISAKGANKKLDAAFDGEIYLLK
ncbi:MAG: hypothetical protein V1688_00135 [bacterium]